MALPSSGPISLSQVNGELSQLFTAQISMNDSNVRALFGVASGAISMSNGYGKSASGQIAYTTPGTYTFIPAGYVTSVCVVCVGGGQGGQSTSNYGIAGKGGALRYRNNIAVTPGSSYSIVVGAGGTANGAAGGNSSAGGVVIAAGGNNTGSSFDSGGDGGIGSSSFNYGNGGAGAGGYSGNGGNTNASGNGGGGAGGSQIFKGNNGGGGGGVGILGEGASGSPPSGGGSGGTAGNLSGGGSYGGGGGGGYGFSNAAGTGGGGAVRIIWGSGRAFPSTNTGNV